MNYTDKKNRLKNKCDHLWFEVLLKDRCEVCGEKAIQVHHFYKKSSYGFLRYDLDNGISLCKHCHFVLHSQDPKMIEDNIEKARGKKWREKIRNKSINRPDNFQTNMKYYEETEKKFDKILGK